jgi:hypothetical protein
MTDFGRGNLGWIRRPCKPRRKDLSLREKLTHARRAMVARFAGPGTDKNAGEGGNSFETRAKFVRKRRSRLSHEAFQAGDLKFPRICSPLSEIGPSNVPPYVCHLFFIDHGRH